MKKLLSISLIIMLIITFVQIISAYALYKDMLSGEYASKLGEWAVKVNGTDIVTEDGQAATFEMSQDDMSYVETEYVAGTGLAPDSEGSFSIEIDATEADVAVKYSITVGEITQYRVYPEDYDPNTDEIPVAKNLTTPFTFEVQGVEDAFIDSSNQSLTGDAFTSKTKTDVESNTVIGVIPLNKSMDKGCKDKVKVTFKWINDDTNTSLEDALVANDKEQDELNDIKLIIPVHVNLLQYMGEVL